VTQVRFNPVIFIGSDHKVLPAPADNTPNGSLKDFAIEKFIENDSGGENSMTIFVNLETIFVIKQNLSISLYRITK
jgi:hypothetical protein